MFVLQKHIQFSIFRYTFSMLCNRGIPLIYTHTVCIQLELNINQQFIKLSCHAVRLYDAIIDRY